MFNISKRRNLQAQKIKTVGITKAKNLIAELNIYKKELSTEDLLKLLSGDSTVVFIKYKESPKIYTYFQTKDSYRYYEMSSQSDVLSVLGYFRVSINPCVKHYVEGKLTRKDALNQFEKIRISL